ncbi:transposase [Fusibacter paucivorans]|uniref:Transposase n=1 Tax=Fusibacter paucivorans TaxID=76009 RepID=A0ABS5PR30_9FIRM|nr:transposase [Fusibacter paucivorans]MBS7527618.1 transposase [Fusibacter paucivorans]
MARKARKLDAFGIYAIRQTASDNRPLFQDDADRVKFLKIVKQAKMRFKFKLYAFCVKASSHYDLIIDANGSDLSQVMKSINIAYAMYVGAEGKLFKDRYKSEQLLTGDPVRSRIRQFLDEQMSCEHLQAFESVTSVIDLYAEGDEGTDDTTVCENCLQDMDAAVMKLAEIARTRQCPVGSLLKDKVTRDQLILDFRRSSTLSLKELGEVFGGLSESTVCKILKDQCRKAF